LNKIDLSIIIVNWNTRELLHNCISSLIETSAEIKIEIIVVDNASKDGSRDMVRNAFPNVIIINSGANIGFARANNLAIPQVQSSNVLFLNPDTIIKNGALQKMTNVLLENHSIGAAGCKILDMEGKTVELPFQIEGTPLKMLFLQIFPFNLIKRIFPYQNPYQNGYVKNLFGACLMVRKKVLDQVGYFDEQFFMYAEDIDLCQRIHKNGWQLYYLSDAEIIHLEGGASDKAPSDFSTLMMCESVSKLMYKNYGKIGIFIYKFGVIISSLLRLVFLFTIRALNAIMNSKEKKYVHNIHKHLTKLKWCLFNPLKK
jgi:GT2 family glycosyltransferase